MPVDHPTAYEGIIVRLRSEGESAMFRSIVNEALKEIARQPVGKRLLDGIHSMAHKKKFGYTVCIMRPNSMECANGSWCGTNVARRSNEAAALSGGGTVTAIQFNANIVDTPDGKRPAFIGLAHELIHAYYNLTGEALAGAEEELATVGLSQVHQRAITENMIRAEHGVPARAAYSGL